MNSMNDVLELQTLERDDEAEASEETGTVMAQQSGLSLLLCDPF